MQSKWTEEDEKKLEQLIKSMNDMAAAACLPTIQDRVQAKGQSFEEWKEAWRKNAIMKRNQND